MIVEVARGIGRGGGIYEEVTKDSREVCILWKNCRKNCVASCGDADSLKWPTDTAVSGDLATRHVFFRPLPK